MNILGNHAAPCILIVDDEQKILNSLTDLLRKDFYVLTTTSVKEALEALERHDAVTIVISDQRMPEMTGVKFLEKAAEISPDTARILITAYADINTVIGAVNQGKIMQYITKPWGSDELLETLKLISERHNLFRENQQLVNQLIHALQPGDAPLPPGNRRQGSPAMRLRDENHLLRQACHQIQRSQQQLEKVREIKSSPKMNRAALRTSGDGSE